MKFLKWLFTHNANYRKFFTGIIPHYIAKFREAGSAGICDEKKTGGAKTSPLQWLPS